YGDGGEAHSPDGNSWSSGRGKASRDERDQRGPRQPGGTDHEVLANPLDDQGRGDRGGPVTGGRVAGRCEPGAVAADGDLPGAARQILAGWAAPAGVPQLRGR